MAIKKCNVPMGLEVDEAGNAYYVRCDKEATNKVGDWDVCEKHEKYYAKKESTFCKNLISSNCQN